jgi:CubicO group peptidase (beta-lactamase class C family)
MKPVFLRVALANVGCLAAYAFGQSNAPSLTPAAPGLPGFAEKAKRLDGLFSSTARNGGSYILNYRVGEQSFIRAYGYLDCARTQPMRADALFDGGSLTKSFTTVAIYKLVEERRLKLDDRLGDLFDHVPAAKRNITVSQLLQHRSGVPNFITAAGARMPESEWSVETYDYAPLSKSGMLRLAWITPLEFAPGIAESYSNLGFNVLGAIIERASGQPYETYLRTRIFRRLGMASTGYLQLEHRGRPVAQQCRGGTHWGDPLSKGVWQNGVSWRLMATGGMMTTADDLQRFSAGIASNALFRPDIGQRFRATYFGPSYRCGTEASFAGGSNRMTRSLIVHLPARQEAVVAVSTDTNHRHPEEGDLRASVCGR